MKRPSMPTKRTPTRPPPTTRVLRRAALALALVAGVGAAPFPVTLAPPATAQDLPEPGDGFAWERVGDVSVEPYDLAFGPDGTLWGNAVHGIYRLNLSDGFPGEWELLHESGRFSGSVLPLGGDGPDGPDTLLATTSLRVERSTDGGQTWEQVYYNQLIRSGTLYAVPAGHPHAGRLFVGGRRVVAYSDDRGSTWSESVSATFGGLPAGAYDLATFPPTSLHPGRIVAGTIYGGALSDDGGETWRPSDLWLFYHHGETLTLVEHSGGSGINAVLGGFVTVEPHPRVWRSEDEGETWEPGSSGLPLPESPPNYGLNVPVVLSLGGASVLAVLYGGTVYRSDDAGETWAAVGRAPDVDESTYATAAALGPDGRLYVGLQDASLGGGGWVWRTGEVLTVAAEPPPAPEEGALGLSVAPNPSRGAAGATLSLAEPAEVRAVLLDPLGREVAVLHEGPLGAGRHVLSLGTGSLPPGVYVVRVAAGEAVATQPVTLLR